jgi:hypothetical protein
MATARVVIGQLPGGGFGIKSSLPGIDVRGVPDDDTQKLSFSSNWQNVAQVHLTGIADLSGGSKTIFWNPLGFIPFIEVRGRSGNVLFDDFNVQTPPNGNNGSLGGFRTALFIQPANGSASVSNVASAFASIFFVVYRIQAF